MDGSDSLLASFSDQIGSIDQTEWDRLAGDDNPFISYAFLESLEQSLCVGAATGWQPYHMSLCAEGDDKPLAVMPLYLKNHSYGEYVFDHSWAHAFERAGGRYYPKLQASVPFTPVTGPRLLTAARTGLEGIAAEGLKGLSKRLGTSSVHITFAHEAEAEAFENAGFLKRMDQQFHWRNRGYRSFEDFLSDLASRKRKQIRKERKKALENGHRIKWYSGASELTEARWDRFFDFYLDTGRRKWGQPYLNRDFFSLIGDKMADRIVLMLVEASDGEVIAGALNFVGGDTLYGRYWGAATEVPCLHFETCYYQAIDYAIAHGLNTVEAGAQGQHKLARGYEPKPTYSVHWISNPGFRDAVQSYLAAERREVNAEIDYLSDHHTPFRKGPVSGS